LAQVAEKGISYIINAIYVTNYVVLLVTNEEVPQWLAIMHLQLYIYIYKQQPVVATIHYMPHTCA
jgi:hypothetical protein